jgi:hypothetical protein
MKLDFFLISLDSEMFLTVKQFHHSGNRFDNQKSKDLIKKKSSCDFHVGVFSTNVDETRVKPHLDLTFCLFNLFVIFWQFGCDFHAGVFLLKPRRSKRELSLVSLVLFFNL